MYLNNEQSTLIQSHLRDATGREWTIDTITVQPYYKQIWAWWSALAYFKIDHHYLSLEDAPEGLNSLTIMSNNRNLYKWRNGQ